MSMYGIFAYNKETDQIIYTNYNQEIHDAIIEAERIVINEPDLYTEVWSIDEDGLYGNCGEPIYKSDMNYNDLNDFWIPQKSKSIS